MNAVAQAAGVATSTVSRFVKGELQLVGETEERVLSAMSELGYSYPERTRRAAHAPSCTGVIAVMVPELRNSYYATFAEEAVQTIEALGFLPIVLSVGINAHQSKAYLEMLANGGLAGVVSIGTVRNGESRKVLLDKAIPLVIVDEAEGLHDPLNHQIQVDNYSGARQVVTYLTRIGHRRIAFVSGPRELSSVSERRRGYEDGMRAAGISVDDQFDLEGECSEDFGFAALTELLSFGRERPTAAFIAADEIAIGLLAAAHRLNVRVPEDLSVVGFDDIAAASRTVPTLTTVRTPVDKLAELAVLRLTDGIIGAQDATGGRSVVPVGLVVRDSSGPPA
jgi:DNA-binding LacI/PurR family transcriptional regulator